LWSATAITALAPWPPPRDRSELVQLKWRLKEVENILHLTAEKEALGKQRAEAREALAAAQHERETRRKERIQLWSQHFLARVQDVVPGVERARIDPDAHTTLIGHTVFEDSSVSGGERILRNVCALLALRNVAREVPSAPIPSLLAVNFPVYGSYTNETDRHTGTRLLEQLIDTARDGRGQVLIATRALPASARNWRWQARPWMRPVSESTLSASSAPGRT
jgi:hypothetical protein